MRNGDWLVAMGVWHAEREVSFEERKSESAEMEIWEACIGMREFESKYPYLCSPAVCFIALSAARWSRMSMFLSSEHVSKNARPESNNGRVGTRHTER